MAPLPIQCPDTASPFVSPSSCPAFPMKWTPQASHYPSQCPKSEFLQNSHISSRIHPTSSLNLHLLLILFLYPYQPHLLSENFPLPPLMLLILPYLPQIEIVPSLRENIVISISNPHNEIPCGNLWVIDGATPSLLLYHVFFQLIALGECFFFIHVDETLFKGL